MSYKVLEIILSRPETYPKSFYFKPIDPPKKSLFFWGGGCTIKYFFNFGDMIMIQNMKNIKSKFRIDLEYFGQHLVNAG